ncbi:MAG TPA: thioesterase family protein [Pirellulales bacterium]|jgi:acyl-CoA thioester hydrolase
MFHPDISPEQFRATIDWPIQWGDQDMFGHVNNIVYFRWFESGRVDYLNRLGFSRMHGTAEHGPILANATCNYRRQLTFPDTVRLGARAVHVGRSSIRIEHAVFSVRQGLALAADGTSTIVMFNYEAQTPIPVPDEIRRAIEELEGRKFE